MNIADAYDELLNQGSSLFMEQIATLTSFQLNFLRALSDGVHTGFTSESTMNSYNLGTKSNVSRIQKALIEKELVEKVESSYHVADPVFAAWFKRCYMD